MDLNQALAKHIEWKAKLRNAITNKETMDVATISADNCCDLGKWLHGEAKETMGDLPGYQDTVMKHAIFHREAGKVASAINAQQFNEAEAMLKTGSPYATASSAVGMAISDLRKETSL